MIKILIIFRLNKELLIFSFSLTTIQFEIYNTGFRKLNSELNIQHPSHKKFFKTSSYFF